MTSPGRRAPSRTRPRSEARRVSLRCKRLVRYLSDYIDGDMDAAVRRHLEAHLDDCAPCRVFIRNLRGAVRILRRQGRVRPSESQRRRLRAGLRRCLKSA